MKRNIILSKSTFAAAAASFGLAVIAATYLGLAPCSYKSVSVRQEIGGQARREVRREVSCQSLIQSQGSTVLGWLALPVLVTGSSLLALRFRYRVLLWVLSILLMAFVIITGFSIGLPYFPAAVLLLVAAILQTVQGSEAAL